VHLLAFNDHTPAIVRKLKIQLKARHKAAQNANEAFERWRGNRRASQVVPAALDRIARPTARPDAYGES
jgi:hypothetical protein